MPFQPGQSGNPGGRPRDNQRVKLLAQAHTEAAVLTLAEVMNDHMAKAGERVAAATALLDRGHGKPHQTAELDVRGTLTQTIESLPVSPLRERLLEHEPVSVEPGSGQ